ncbi:mechanosensitive ion channel domain-containing protein [Entomobacter blattae]|uniref:Mechanosensitive ion channel n=1 Tax=Entomobacter blattae TaxID=2762277 RepID=A0A7H1NNY2_9PROT|nr:mechanosensitive ion channel domain-containing protein [Entomobacter blattae]QNT77492.1 Mechanosensitive ion channel [Entomobacter blattae]
MLKLFLKFIPFLCILTTFCLATPAIPVLLLPQAVAATSSGKEETDTKNLSPQDAKETLDILRNPQKRDELIKTLSTISQAASTGKEPVAAPSTPVPKPAAEAEKVSIDPDSLGGSILSQLDDVGDFLSTQFSSFIALFKDLVFVGSWFTSQLSNPEARSTLIDTFTRSGIIFLVALSAERLLFLAIRKPVRKIAEKASYKEISSITTSSLRDLSSSEEENPEETSKENETPDLRNKDAKKQHEVMRFMRRIPYAFLHLFLKLLPVVCFAAIGYLGGEFLTKTVQGHSAIVTLTTAYTVARLLYLAVEVVFTPKAPSIRLASASDETAKLIMNWWALLVAAPLITYTLLELGAVFHLSPRGTKAIIRIVILIEHILLAIFIWRIRKPVANLLRPPKKMTNKPFWNFLGKLINLWWVPAIVFDIGLWIIWVTNRRDGYSKMWWATIATITIIGIARLVTVIILGKIDHVLQALAPLDNEGPSIQQRINNYYPHIRKIISWFIIVIAAIIIGQAWGLSTFKFLLTTPLGQNLIYSVTVILIAIIVGILIWESVNFSLEKKISQTTTPEDEIRATRLKTLLPIIRTILFIGLSIILLLTGLSQIGINITPLLAGASILGVAISFGSQKLVQDFITGFFLLVENAIQVGDSITAAGVSGTVEHLSIRTLKLRATDGSLQIIPFSAVGSVINQSRDFSVAVLSLAIDRSEDAQKVCALITDTGNSLAHDDSPVKNLLLGDFILNGVDTIDEYSMTITGSIRCTANNRAIITREFNLRLQKRLEEEHIRTPRALRGITNIPHQTLDVTMTTAKTTPPSEESPKA